MIKTLALTSMLATLLLAQSNYKTLDTPQSYNAAITSCKQLGKEWRLGEIWELHYLKKEGKEYKTNRVFWSATSLKEINKNTLNKALSFHIKDGTMTSITKENKNYVICTNLPKIAQTQQHFKKTSSGVVDTLNNLLWEDASQKRLSKKLSFEDAGEFCEEKKDMDREWRLPSLNELYSIVNYGYIKPALNSDIFPSLQNKYYWTNDTFKEKEAYMVGFKFGLIVRGKQNHKINFICVSDK